MKIKLFIYISCLVVLGSCSESKYNLDQLVPEEYHKILYIKNSGKQEITLYDTNEDNIFTLSVVKSGSEPNQSASANIRVLGQAEVDAEYSDVEGVNYKVIKEDSYAFQAIHLEFDPVDRYKLIDVSLNPQKIKECIESDLTAVWVLPMQVISEVDSINANKDRAFLQITGVITPALGFVDSEFELNEYDWGSTSTISKSLEISLDTDNKWDIEWEVKEDLEYIESYNVKNGTDFVSLPRGSFSIPELMSLSSGVTKIKMDVTINGKDLTPGDYMLPIRIENASLFEVSSTKSVYPLAIRVLGSKLNTTDWTAEANTEEPNGEGAGNGRAICVLDGNLSTYWHSSWQNGSHPLPHELIIDTQKEYTFTQLAIMQRQDENYTDTKEGELYVSSNKKEWNKVGTFFLKKELGRQIFNISSTKGRYIKISITSSYRGLNCSLSEVYIYGVK